MAAPDVVGGGAGFAPAAGAGGAGGNSSVAPAFTGVPAVYFWSGPDTRAALSASTRMS